jgi:hypothetical protein
MRLWQPSSDNVQSGTLVQHNKGGGSSTVEERKVKIGSFPADDCGVTCQQMVVVRVVVVVVVVLLVVWRARHGPAGLVTNVRIEIVTK